MKKSNIASMITIAMINIIAFCIPAIIIWNVMKYIITLLSSTLLWNYVLMIVLVISFLAVFIGTLIFWVCRIIVANLIVLACDKIVEILNK